MAKDTNLSAHEIYEKEFHVDLKGYASAEVDDFLDLVIEDYQTYDENSKNLVRLLLAMKQRSRSCSRKFLHCRPAIII